MNAIGALAVYRPQLSVRPSISDDCPDGFAIHSISSTIVTNERSLFEARTHAQERLADHGSEGGEDEPIAS